MVENGSVGEVGVGVVLARIPERWGRTISCGEGWHPLIVSLNESIAEVAPDYELHQVKEKFGGLRFYWAPPEGVAYDDATTSEIRGLVDEAERKSFTVCERCGAAGSLRTKRWWRKTLCNICVGGYDDQPTT